MCSLYGLKDPQECVFAWIYTFYTFIILFSCWNLLKIHCQSHAFGYVKFPNISSSLNKEKRFNQNESKYSRTLIFASSRVKVCRHFKLTLHFIKSEFTGLMMHLL